MSDTTTEPRRVGRPRTYSAAARTAHIDARVTPAQLTACARAAKRAGLTLSEWAARVLTANATAE